MTRDVPWRSSCCGRSKRSKGFPRRHSMSEPVSHHENRRETTDASLRWVLLTLAVAGVAGVLISLAVELFLNGYEGRRAAEQAPSHALTPGPEPRLPREPRLEQIDRRAGLEPNSAAAEPTADTYGPSGERGFVRVPVERAMD